MATARKIAKHFTLGKGTYTCDGCGKLTRETDPDAAFNMMCAHCWEMAGWENAVLSGELTWLEVPEKYRPEGWEQFPEVIAQRTAKQLATALAQLDGLNAEQLKQLRHACTCRLVELSVLEGR